MSKCELCPLHKTSKANCVPLEGGYEMIKTMEKEER